MKSQKKLAVFFPGRKYGVDCPLLYYTDFICKKLGYECEYLHYAAHREDKTAITIEEDIANAKDYVFEKLNTIDMDGYDEILFVSKSIGTVLAAMAQERCKRRVRNLFLTPLEQTLTYLEKCENVQEKDTLVVAGTKDSFLEAEKLTEVCLAKNLYLFQVEGVGHSIESDDVGDSLEIMKDVMEIVQEWIICN